MSREDRIRQLLTDAFSPVELEVSNDSEKHRGHAGYSDGETHYAVRIVADVFEGQNRVNRQRLVNKAIQPEFDAGLHALQLKVLAPGE